MNDAQLVRLLLWGMGIVVTCCLTLIGVIYYLIKESIQESKKENKESREALQKAKDDAAETHREMWLKLNGLWDRFHEINTTHVQLCQKHEDKMSSLDSTVSKHTTDIYKWRDLLATIRGTLENRLNEAESKIKELVLINQSKRKP